MHLRSAGRLPVFALLLLGALSARGTPAEEPAARVDRYGDPLPPSARSRIGSPRFRHGGEIVSIAFAPDGRTLATAGRDRILSLWDATSGKGLAHFRAPECVAVTFAERGRALLWCDARGSLYRCDTAQRGADLDGRRERIERFTPAASGQIETVAFSPDGAIAALGSNACDVYLWRMKKRVEIRLPDPVQGLALAADGRWLAVNRGWAGTALYELTNHEARGAARVFGTAAIRSLAFSPDGRIVAAGDFDNRIHLWDAATGRPLRTLDGHRRVAISGRNGVFWLAFAPGGAALASGAADGTVRVWDVKSGRQTACCAGGEGRVLVLAFAPDGQTLATGGADGIVRLWDAATGREVGPTKDADGAITEMSLSPNGRTLALVRRPGGLRLVDLATGGAYAKSPNESAVLRAAFCADGRTLVFASADGRLHFWDAVTGENRRPTQDVRMTIRLVAGATARWNPYAKSRMEVVRTPIRLLALAGDGETLAFCGSNCGIVVWDAKAGEERYWFPARGRAISALLFSPNGRRLLVAEPGAVMQWQVNARSFGVAPPVPATGTLSAAVSPDGRMLATGGQDGTVRLWEMASRRQRRAMSGDTAFVRSLAFSADGELLASGSSNGTVRLWDVANGRCLHTFAGHRGDVVAAAFAGRGTLVTAGRDGTALVWDVPPPREAGRGRDAELSQEQLRSLWRDLGGENAAAAYEVAQTLSRAPEQTVPFVRARVAPSSAEKLARRIEELDSERFEVRAGAMKELAQMGKFAEGPLRKLLTEKPSLEVRRRAEELLELFAEPIAGTEHLRALRAVEVLEWIGTPPARKALQALAAGAAEAPLTQEAKAALDRLSRK